MKTIKVIPAFCKILNFVVVLSFFAACDQMNLNPANISNNVDTEFSADDSAITLGEGTTIHWAISDPDGVVKTINFSGGGEDKIVNLTGSTGVSPTESTVYYIDVMNADEKILKSAQIKVQVLDESGQEIVDADQGEGTGTGTGEAGVETLCEDSLDNDGDSLFDCSDPDCAADPICEIPETPEVQASFTTPPSATLGELVCLGDEIVVTWVSDFAGVQVSDSSGGERYFVDAEAITGSYSLVLTDDVTTVTLIGYKDYAASEPETVTIETSSEEDCNPGFIGTFSAGAIPSKTLIKGEAYALYWKSTNIAEVLLGGVSVGLDQEWEDSEIYSAAQRTHSFTLIDTQDPAFTDDTRSVAVTANAFSTVAQASLASGVSKVIPGEDASVAYILTGTKVVKATEYLTVFTDVLDTSAMSLAESGLTGYAVTSNGKTFVSTKNYVYLIDGTTAKKIVDFNGYSDDFAFTFLHASGENVVVGSTSNLLKLDTAGDCDDGDGDSNDNDGAKVNDVCVLQIDLDGDIIGGKTSIDETGDYRQVFKKYSSSGSSDTVFLITAEGVYKSTNGGSSFTSTVSEVRDVKGGAWFGTNNGYVWTNSTVYEYDNGKFDVIVEGLTAAMTGGEIYYVNASGERLFVATKNGVYVKNTVGWSESNVLQSKVPLIVFTKSASLTARGITAGAVKLTSNVLGLTEHTAVLLTSTGSTATVSYKNGNFGSFILNATSIR